MSSGAVAAVLVAAMIVSVTPRTSSAPSAVSATTTPSVSALARPQAAAMIDTTDDHLVRLGTGGVSTGRPALALVGAPNAISSAPTADPTGLDPAGDLPDPDDRVLVLTAAFTYDVAWGVVDDLWAPPGSIVMTHDGELLAAFGDDGRAVLD